MIKFIVSPHKIEGNTNMSPWIIDDVRSIAASRCSEAESIKSNLSRAKPSYAIKDYNIITNESIGNRRNLQQSHSVSHIRQKDYENGNSVHSEKESPSKVSSKHAESQSGDNLEWMWLNHFRREEQAISKRNQKFEMQDNLILNNLSKFGTEYNNINETK